MNIPTTRSFYSFLLIIILSGACRNAPGNSTDVSDLEPVFHEHFGDKTYQLKWNKSRTYLLAISGIDKQHQKDLPQTLHFIVLKAKENSVVYEKHITDGKVQWYDDTKLKISGYQERVDGPEDKGNTFLYDVKEKRIIKYPIRTI